ncbi:MAG TPA: carbohydrate kinase [Bryobacteraceae bacterium]|nr:carbohydrate kinase [Bryobacteraceae bacterium]
MRVLVIGEVLWDVFPDAEHLGGAPFNFAAHLRRLGHDVLFVSGVGHDERGRRVLREMEQLGLRTSAVSIVRGRPTGYVSVSIGPDGKHDFEIHRPAAYLEPALGDGDLKAVTAWQPDWVYTGTLAQTAGTVRALTLRLFAAAPKARRFYDVNLRKSCYSPELLQALLPQTNVIKLNDAEAEQIAGMFFPPFRGFEALCRDLQSAYGAETICVTRGAAGCSVLHGKAYVEASGYAVKTVDSVGAGDAFGAAFMHGLSLGWSAARAANFANRLGALVAARAGAIPEWTAAELEALA